MGTTYVGPFAEHIGDHEGYPAYVLDDGTTTGTHSAETIDRMTGFLMSACECGWTGGRYMYEERLDSETEGLAMDEWETSHIYPLVDQVAEQYTVSGVELLRLAREIIGRARVECSRPAEERDGRERGLREASIIIDRFVGELPGR